MSPLEAHIWATQLTIIYWVGVGFCAVLNSIGLIMERKRIYAAQLLLSLAWPLILLYWLLRVLWLAVRVLRGPNDSRTWHTL